MPGRKTLTAVVWRSLLGLLLSAVPAFAQLQTVYVHPQEVRIDPTGGGVLQGKCLNKGVVGAPRDADKITEWSNPDDVVIVQEKKAGDNPFNPGPKGERVEKTLAELMKAEKPWVEVVGAADTSGGVNLRVKLTEHADPDATYTVKVKRGVGAARPEEKALAAKTFPRVFGRGEKLDQLERTLSKARTEFGTSPLGELVNGYAQDRVYWPLGEGKAVADPHVVVADFMKEVTAVANGLPAEQRAAFLRLNAGVREVSKPTKAEPRPRVEGGRLSDGSVAFLREFGLAEEQLPEPTAAMNKALDAAGVVFEGYFREAARRYADGLAPAKAADLPELKLAAEYVAFLHHRQAAKLSLGDGSIGQAVTAVQALAQRPLAVTFDAKKGFELSLPDGGPVLNLTKLNRAVQEASGKLTKESVDALADGVRKAEADLKTADVRTKPAGHTLDMALLRAEVAVREYRETPDDPAAKERVVMAASAVTVAAEQAKVELSAATSALRVPEADLPAEWALLAGGAKGVTDTGGVYATAPGPRLIDTSKLSADELRQFTRQSAPALGRRMNASLVFQQQVTPQAKLRAAGLGFGDKVAVLADELTLKDVVASVGGTKFSVGKACLADLKLIGKALAEQGVADIEFRVAHTKKGDDVIARWRKEAAAGTFKGKLVVLAFCPDVPAKEQYQLVTDLLTKFDAAGVVVTNDKVNVPVVTMAITELADLAAERPDVVAHLTPEQMIGVGFRLAELRLNELAEKPKEEQAEAVEKAFGGNENGEYILELLNAHRARKPADKTPTEWEKLLKEVRQHGQLFDTFSKRLTDSPTVVG